MMDREQRKAAWAAACQRWLDVGFRQIAEHARTLAKGHRGVLSIQVDADELTRALNEGEGPAMDAFVEFATTWIPADEFLKSIKNNQEDHETWQRWAPTLAAMEPGRDVALYLHSDPSADPEGYNWSRFVFVTGPATAFNAT